MTSTFVNLVWEFFTKFVEILSKLCASLFGIRGMISERLGTRSVPIGSCVIFWKGGRFKVYWIECNA